MKNNSRDKLVTGDIASLTARICRVSDNHVRKVTRGDRDNELVFTVYMTLWEGKEKLIEEVTQMHKELTQKNKAS